MKIIFFGTPEFAVPSLNELVKHYKVLAVVTREDKPYGRGLKVRQSPVKKKAKELKIAVLQPQDLSELKEHYKELNPDISIVSAYGKILPEWILQHKLGALNIHASLLPKYRGAAPIQRAILNDEHESGVTIQKMVAELDAGDILGEKKVAIDSVDTAGTLHDKLAVVSADLLLEVLLNFNSIKPIKQDESVVSWADKIEKDESRVNWDFTHVEIYNLIRALNPVPGARAILKGIPVKIWQAKLDERQGLPGQVIEISKSSFVISCGKGSLRLEIIQPANKNKIRGFEFARNLQFKEGEIIIEG